MKQAFDAIYQNGAFRPVQPAVTAITDGQRVRITVDDEGEFQPLRLAASVYDGLSDADIREIEEIALHRGPFFGSGNGQ